MILKLYFDTRAQKIAYHEILQKLGIEFKQALPGTLRLMRERREIQFIPKTNEYAICLSYKDLCKIVPNSLMISHEQTVEKGENIEKRTKILSKSSIVSKKFNLQDLKSEFSRYDLNLVKNITRHLNAGLQQQNIAKINAISPSKVFRITKKLEKLGIIESYNRYPRFYRVRKDLMYNYDFLTFYESQIKANEQIKQVVSVSPQVTTKSNSSEPKKKEKRGSWPIIAENVHWICYKTPLLQPVDPKKVADAYKVKKWKNSNKYIYKNFLKDWTIEITTRNVFWRYRFPKEKIRDLTKFVEDFKSNIPYHFLTNKVKMDIANTKKHGKWHCVFKTGTELDNMGKKELVQIKDGNDNEIMHADDSPKLKTGELEADVEKAQSIFEVPIQIKNMNENISQMAKGMENLTKAFMGFTAQITELVNQTKNLLSSQMNQVHSEQKFTNFSKSDIYS